MVCTNCTILSDHTVAGARTLNNHMSNKSFATIKNTVLPARPVQLNTCLQCASAFDGDNCQNCIGGAYNVSTSCPCLYTNETYESSTAKCVGTISVTSLIISSDTTAYAVECNNRSIYVIGIDTSFDKVTDFGIFKDDLCGLHNIKISGTLKISTTADGCTISGLVSIASGSINNITSSLVITHTGHYLNRCSHIASNVVATTETEFVSISNVTLTGSMSVTGTSDFSNVANQRNIGGIIARAYQCKVNISGIAINGY